MADFKTAKEKNSKMSTENASETAPLRLTADGKKVELDKSPYLSALHGFLS